MREINKNLNQTNTLESLFKQDTLKLLDLLTIKLFELSKSKAGDYTPTNIQNHVNFILTTLKTFKVKGFIANWDLDLTNNPVLNICLSLFPVEISQKISVKDTDTPSMRDEQIFYREHLFNLILLSILKEILKMNDCLKDKILSDIEKEVFFELINQRNEITHRISGNIRRAIGMNRLRVLEDIYTGFDTEYVSREYKQNDLLCSTIAIFPRLSVQIQKFDPLSINFSLNQEPCIFRLDTSLSFAIFGFVALIRDLDGRQDNFVNLINLELLNMSSGDLFCYDEKQHYTFTFNHSFTQDNIITKLFDHRDSPSEYSLRFLVNQISLLSKDQRNKEKLRLINLLKEICNRIDDRGLMSKELVKVDKEKGTDTFKITQIQDRRISTKKSLILSAHFTPADMGSWSDFEEHKKEFGIIQGKFVSVNSPYRLKGCDENFTISLRDTALLAPSGRSLKAIGELYPDLKLNKIDIGEYISKMDILFKVNPVLFEEYAIRDSVITLFHILKIEDSSYSFLQRRFVPVTLGAFAGMYYKTKLVLNSPPVDNAIYSMSDLPRLFTNKGINLTGPLTIYLPYVIGSYHGGRNESFAYGYAPGFWYDYDLPSAYPTAMSLLKLPDYSKFIHLQNEISGQDLRLKYSDDEIIFSFTSLYVDFLFPKEVMYPNLPVRLEPSSIIFPRSGTAFITGHEFLLASNLGCTILIKSGIHIPFLTKETKRIPGYHKLLITDTSDLDKLTGGNLTGCKNENENKNEKEIQRLGGLPSLSLSPNNPNDTIQKAFESYEANGFNGLIELEKELKRTSEETELDRTSEETDLDLDLEETDLDKNEKDLDKNANLSEVRLSEVSEISEEIKEFSDKFIMVPNTLTKPNSKTEFFNFVKGLIEKRGEYPKGSYDNELYKLIANAGIGHFGRGQNYKTSFDSKTGTTQHISGGSLSNPLLAGWITSFIRTVLSELMDFIDKKGFKILSCTTDGFITNFKNLNNLDSDSGCEAAGPFTRAFIEARYKLKSVREILELKITEPEGVLTWTTRGQLGRSSKLIAMTGFSQRGFTRDEIRRLVDTSLSINRSRTIPFIAEYLDTAINLYKKGGPVSMKITERMFHVMYDNRRRLQINKETLKTFDFSKGVIYSIPHNTPEDCKTFRTIFKLDERKYLKSSIMLTHPEDKLSYLSLAARMFIRGIKQDPKYLGIDIQVFSRERIAEIISEASDGKVQMSYNNISKQNHRPFIPNRIPRVSLTVDFINRLRVIFPNLKEEVFFKKS